MQQTEKPEGLRRMTCRKCGVSKPIESFTIPAATVYDKPNIVKRRSVLRQTVSEQTLRSFKQLYKMLLLQDYDWSMKTAQNDLNALKIMLVPCYELGYSIYGLPQGVLECSQCEAPQLTKKERSQKPSLKQPKRIEVDRRYCVACKKDSPIQTFEGKSYCQECGVAFYPRTCSICEKERQPYEIDDGDCVYCLLERRRTKDILRVRAHMKLHSVAAVKIQEYIQREFPKLIGLEME